MNALQEFVDYINVEKRYSAYTVRAYTDDIRKFAVFQDIDTSTNSLLKVTRDEIRQWIVYMMNGHLEARSIRRKIISLRSFYKFCLRNGYITQNPAEGVSLPKLSKDIPAFVKESSIELLFDDIQFPNDFPGIRDRLVLELFYATGMRLSEMVGLKPGSYNQSKGEIRLLGKRKKERVVPLTQICIRILDSYIVTAGQVFGNSVNDSLILTNSGKPAYPRMIQRLVRKYLTIATSLEKRSPHVLRHTFATHMLNNGAELNAVKELLGHANLAATEIYTHNTYEKLKLIYKQAHPRA